MFAFKKHIICVSENGICSRSFGVCFLCWNLLLIVWSFYTTVRFFELTNSNAEKEIEISLLKDDKQKLTLNIVFLNDNLKNINNFISSINKYDRLKDITKNDFFDINKNELPSNTNLVLERINSNVKNINLALKYRAKNLDGIIKNIYGDDIQPVSFDFENPVYSNDIIDESVSKSIIIKKELDKNIDNLSSIENYLNNFPLSKPLANSRVSSHFGVRVDPFTGQLKNHDGVDLAAPYLSKVSVTADGKVVFAGNKGGYGKTVIVEHKGDIKTIYGHLSTIVVDAGQEVKKGDTIGIQGSTGRSTNDHLHYEIVRNINRRAVRFNPENVLKIGNDLY